MGKKGMKDRNKKGNEERDNVSNIGRENICKQGWENSMSMQSINKRRKKKKKNIIVCFPALPFVFHFSFFSDFVKHLNSSNE